MGKLPMDIMTPMPEVIEKENSMKEALTKPASQNFDASKVAKKSLETIREDRIEPTTGVEEPPAVKKKKPRGMSAMDPEKKAAHMKKMREASARKRKERAEAKKNPPKQNDPPVPEPVHERPEASAPIPVPTPHRPVAVPEQPPVDTARAYVQQPPPQPRPVRPPASPLYHTQEIDYNKLAHVMEQRKANQNKRMVTKQEIDYFEQTVRANERKKTLAELEKEQEKSIQDFMSRRTKKKAMPRAEKSYAVWDSWNM